MSCAPARRKMQIDLDTSEASPFAVAVTSADRAVLDMVRDALLNKRVRLAFQPAVYAADPAIIGFYEGYIRLLDERQITIPARDFMPIVETRELGREIDVAALRLGLTALKRNPGVRIAVNMSARSVGYKPLVQLLRRALGEFPHIGRGLILEINEASAMQMPDVLIPFMDELRGFGITFTLDDFGDSLTSLALLNEFDFDIAKLDGRFIRNCHRDPESQPIIRAAIAMAMEFGMFLVAEAVETSDEAHWLREQGVGCLQGYLFGKPELSPDFSKFLAARAQRAG